MLLLIATMLGAAPQEVPCTALAQEAVGFRNNSAGAMVAGDGDRQVAARQQALVWYTATAIACREANRTPDADRAIQTAKAIVAEFDATGPWTPETCRRRQSGLASSRARSAAIRYSAPSSAGYVDRALVAYTNAIGNKCGS